ncbi:MAG: biotin--[acetyl-CoA-carboxylase] ligase [Pseudomonadota bacterium]
MPDKAAPHAPRSAGWPDGYDRVVLDQVDSTNAEALRRARSITGPVWICALNQSAARGRQGRTWSSPPGNFAATLVLHPVREPPARLALRSFVAALAVHDAVSAVLGQDSGLALKWPNDVLLWDGKLAGILLESSGVPPVLAIGVGVNLACAPSPDQAAPGAFPPVALPHAPGKGVEPLAFLDHLASAYAAREQVFSQAGFEPIRAAWLSRAARLGQPITARTPRGDTTGIFRTVDEDGQLVLSTRDATISIPAADVYF